MCFGGGSKLPPPVAQPTLAIPQTPPIENQLPQTQSGADESNVKQSQAGGTAAQKSMFQLDLSGMNPVTGQKTSTSNSSSSSQTGASPN